MCVCVCVCVCGFYESSKSYVGVITEESELYSVYAGLKHGRAMCSWLFNFYMDGAIKEQDRILIKRSSDPRRTIGVGMSLGS